MRNHKMSLLALLCCSGSALTIAPTPAQAMDLDAYGKLDVQALSVQRGFYRYADQGRQLELPFSRLGIKGQQALTDELSLIFVYEWQVNGLDQANRDHRLGARNTYIGLSGNFGELVFGKNDTKFKKSEGKADLFNEYVADIAQITAGQDRLKNLVSYQSPQWQGFSIGGSYQTAVGKEQAGGHDISLSYGDSALKKLPIFVSLAFAKELNLLDAKRLLLQVPLWQQQDATLAGALMWQHSEHQLSGKSGNSRMVQLSYQQQAWTAKLQWQDDDSKLRQKTNARLLSAGLDHQLNAQLSWYSLVSRMKLDTVHDHAIATGLKFSF
jgi:predicted porin